MIMDRLSAAGFDIHFFEAESLVAAIDDSCDLPPGRGMESFDDLMTRKYQELPLRLFDDLVMMGIETPVLIDIDEEGAWVFADGHHRLSWALVHQQPVPVIFVDESIDPLELWALISEADVDYDYA